MNEIGPSDRPDLSQPPGGMTPAQPAGAAPATPPPGAGAQPPPPPQGSAAPPVATPGFDLNQPTIISLLYLASFIIPFVTGIVGVVLAYVWKGQPQAEWEVSHYEYHIRSFWIWVIAFVVGIPLLLLLGLGFLLWLAASVLVVVRSILSLIKAQAKEPMPNPDTWLA